MINTHLCRLCVQESLTLYFSIGIYKVNILKSKIKVWVLKISGCVCEYGLYDNQQNV
jgi:hypothetical protein